EPPAPSPVIGSTRAAMLRRALFRAHLRDAHGDPERAAFVLDGVAETFTQDELEAGLTVLAAQHDTRRDVSATVELLRTIAARSYGVEFPDGVELSRRTLWPAVAAESHGMEDARFVRFIESD